MEAPIKNAVGSRAQTNSLCYKRATCVSPNNITHIKPFVTEINGLHSPNSGQRSAVSNQQSAGRSRDREIAPTVSGQPAAVRKIDHKLTVYGTESGFMGFMGFLGVGTCDNALRIWASTPQNSTTTNRRVTP